MASISEVSRLSVSQSSHRPHPESRENNLNAVRLALASLVMLSHSFALSYGSEDYDPIKRLTAGQETCGSLAVDLFFLISGMLITASWFRSKSMNDYLLRRVFRIYPGFIVALAFSALLLWILCPEFRPHNQAFLKWTHDFLIDAATLDQKSLTWPHAFAQSQWPGTANGSMWTIQIEFKCYVLLAIVGLFCLFKRRWWILLCSGAVMAIFTWRVLHSDVSWGHLQVNGGESIASRFYS